MPKISVIIPIYNVEKYLGECLNSVINQTFKDIEIICVDDCGNDKSINIAEEFARNNESIKIIHHKQNEGLAISRNTGMKNATGDYIFFLDSDDYILPDTLEKLYKEIHDTNTDIVVTKPKAFAENGSNVNQAYDINKWIDRSEVGNYKISEENFSVLYKLPVMSWGKLYSKEFLLNNNIKFIEQNVMHEDEGFWIKVCSCFPKISYISDIGVMYRIRQGSITTEITNKKRKHDCKKSLGDCFNYIKKYRRKYAKSLIKQIKKDRYYDSIIAHPYKNFIQNIFSIKNEIITEQKCKIITVLGIKISLKMK